MKILLVDDVRMYAELLREPLAQHGYSSVVATSAAEARSRLVRDAPRLVFLDLHMPGEDGDRLCREIKAGGRLPVVMTGAGGSDDDRRRCEEAGCDAFLVKPARPSLVLETAARFLHVGERTPRVPLGVPVLCEARGLRRLVQSVNLSTGGLFLATSRPLPVGSRVAVEFRLPLERDSTPLRAHAQVVWVNGPSRPRQGPTPGMGLSFTQLAPDVAAAIGRFVTRALAAGGRTAGPLAGRPPRAVP